MKIFILTIIVILTQICYADVKLEFKENETGSIKRKIFLSAPYFRMGVDKSKNYMIYDDSKKAMYMIDLTKKSYMKIDKHFVNKMSEKMNGIRKKGNLKIIEARKRALEKIKNLPPERQEMARQMIMGKSIGPNNAQMLKMRQMAMEKIKNLPPEKQAMAKQMMMKMKMFNPKQIKPKQQIPSMPSKKIEFKKSSVTKTVSGKKCRVYQKIVNDKLKSKLCISRPSDLGIKNEDFKLIKNMVDFHKEIRKSFAEKLPHMAKRTKFKRFGLRKGIPIEITHSGKVGKEVLADISLKRLSPKLFSIPKGFKEMDPFRSRRNRKKRSSRY